MEFGIYLHRKMYHLVLLLYGMPYPVKMRPMVFCCSL